MLYGPNAKDVNLEQLNTLAKALGGPRTFIDKNGTEWTITFDIKYVVADPLTTYVAGLDKTSDQYKQLDLSNVNKTLPPEVKAAIGFTPGDNILRIDNSEWPGFMKGATGQGANGGGALNKLGPIIHESFHMLGFGDRYFEELGFYQPQFNDDVVGQNMTGKGMFIHPVHYTDLIDFLDNGGYLKNTGTKTTTFGYGELKIDMSCSGDIRCQKSDSELDGAAKREIITK